MPRTSERLFRLLAPRPVELPPVSLFALPMRMTIILFCALTVLSVNLAPLLRRLRRLLGNPVVQRLVGNPVVQRLLGISVVSRLLGNPVVQRLLGNPVVHLFLGIRLLALRPAELMPVPLSVLHKLTLIISF